MLAVIGRAAVWAGYALGAWVVGNLVKDEAEYYAEQRRDLAEAKRNDPNGDANTNDFHAQFLEAEAKLIEGGANSPGLPVVNPQFRVQPIS